MGQLRPNQEGFEPTHLRQVAQERYRSLVDHGVGAVGQVPGHERLFEGPGLVLEAVGRLHRHGRDDQVDGMRPVLAGRGTA